MFYCDTFQRHSRRIRHIWDTRLGVAGNWQNRWWWASIVGYLIVEGFVFLGFTAPDPNSMRIRYFLHNIYCPRVGDCVFFGGNWSLPVWYVIDLFLWLTYIVSGLIAQWEYRRERWCGSWWALLFHAFSMVWLFVGIGKAVILMGISGAPIPTAIVGYGMLAVYTIWFTIALLPSMHLLWQGKQVAFRPLPLKLRAGLGGTVGLLGMVGVVLGQILNEIPHGNWGYFIVGIVGSVWLMYVLIPAGARRLVMLAPWRIVLEAEAREQEGGEGQ